MNSKLPEEDDEEIVIKMKLNNITTNDKNCFQQQRSCGEALTDTLDGMQVNRKGELKVYNDCHQVGLAYTSPDGDGFMHLSSHHHHQAAKKDTTPIMIMIGDVIHNMFDGLAIGISYSTGGITGGLFFCLIVFMNFDLLFFFLLGLSTSLAILFHELPHELGDFSIALSSGMSRYNAYLWNMAASFVGMVGCVVGLLLGTLEVSWLSAAVAGTFIYVSLVNMVPELDSCPNLPRSSRVVKLLWQFAGLSFGVCIMAIILIYE